VVGVGVNLVAAVVRADSVRELLWQLPQELNTQSQLVAVALVAREAASATEETPALIQHLAPLLQMVAVGAVVIVLERAATAALAAEAVVVTRQTQMQELATPQTQVLHRVQMVALALYLVAALELLAVAVAQAPWAALDRGLLAEVAATELLQAFLAVRLLMPVAVGAAQNLELREQAARAAVVLA